MAIITGYYIITNAPHYVQCTYTVSRENFARFKVDNFFVIQPNSQTFLRNQYKPNNEQNLSLKHKLFDFKQNYIIFFCEVFLLYDKSSSCLIGGAILT